MKSVVSLILSLVLNIALVVALGFSEYQGTKLKVKNEKLNKTNWDFEQDKKEFSELCRKLQAKLDRSEAEVSMLKHSLLSAAIKPNQ